MTCEDSPCCGCCDTDGDLASPELRDEMDQAELDREDWYPDEVHEASVYGTDERFPDDMHCDGYDEH